MGDCEFCIELQGRSDSRFRRTYPDVESRVIASTSFAVALPSLGQFIRGTMLVIPRVHFETVARCPEDVRDDLLGLAARLASNMSSGVAFFEHGCRRAVGRDGGLFHAHLHVVPIPQGLTPEEVFPEGEAASDLKTAMRRLEHADRYLVYADASGPARLSVLPASPSHAAQFFRRRLSTLVELDAHWNWRAVEREPELLELIEQWHDVSVV